LSRKKVKKLQPKVPVRVWKDKQTTIDENADLNYLVAKLRRPQNWRTKIFGSEYARVYSAEKRGVLGENEEGREIGERERG